MEGLAVVKTFEVSDILSQRFCMLAYTRNLFICHHYAIMTLMASLSSPPPFLSARLMSTDSPAMQMDKFKKALRQLYLTVHPDRSAAWPSDVKAINERSFTLLQSYISQSKSRETARESREGDSRSLFPLTFYIPTSSSSQQQPLGDGSAPGLKCVNMTLLPPSPPSEGTSSFAPSTQRALSRLLVACEMLEDDPSFHSDVYDSTSSDMAPTKSLSTFLPRATEALRQHLASNKDSSVRIANLRGALRMMRGVRVSVSSSVKRARQVETLMSLIRLLDRCPELELDNLHIVIGSETRVYKNGQLELEADGDEMDWEAFLTGVDLSFVRQRAELVQSLRSMEARLASNVGLGLIHTLSSHLTDPKYRSFLENLIDFSNKQQQGIVMSNGRSLLLNSDEAGKGGEGVRLCILPSTARHHGHISPLKRPLGEKGFDMYSASLHQSTELPLSSAIGTVYLSDDLASADVYSILSSSGQWALRDLSTKASLIKQIEDLRLRVRKALRLRRLTIHPLLLKLDEQDALVSVAGKSIQKPVERTKTALLRLLERAGDLYFVVEGSSLLLGFTSQVLADSLSSEEVKTYDQIEGKGVESEGSGEAVIEIPYDFED
jgi:hypothetical protein